MTRPRGCRAGQQPLRRAYDVRFEFTRNPASQIVTSWRSNDNYAFTGAANADQNYAANGLNQYQSVGAASQCHDANGKGSRARRCYDLCH